MKISLDDKHILVSEETCCWVVRVVTTKEGKRYEKRVSGYYATLQGAVESYIDKKINSSEADEIRKLAVAVEELKAEVRAWKPK